VSTHIQRNASSQRQALLQKTKNLRSVQSSKDTLLWGAIAILFSTKKLFKKRKILFRKNVLKKLIYY
jgi:hypothetical protein